MEILPRANTCQTWLLDGLRELTRYSFVRLPAFDPRQRSRGHVVPELSEGVVDVSVKNHTLEAVLWDTYGKLFYVPNGSVNYV